MPKKKKEKDNKKMIAAICGGTVIAIIIIVVALNTIIIRNDCDSPCRGNDNPNSFCAAVCVKTEQTLWEYLTGQDPRFVGY